MTGDLPDGIPLQAVDGQVSENEGLLDLLAEDTPRFLPAIATVGSPITTSHP